MIVQLLSITRFINVCNRYRSMAISRVWLRWWWLLWQWGGWWVGWRWWGGQDSIDDSGGDYCGCPAVMVLTQITNTTKAEPQRATVRLHPMHTKPYAPFCLRQAKAFLSVVSASHG